MKRCCFYFLRHGETDWNQQQILMGAQDIPLNEAGLQQAADVAVSLSNIVFTHIVTSPLRRAQQTATIVAEKCQKSLTIIEGLQEHCLGVWEGKPKDENLYHRLLQGETFDSVESLAAFDGRVGKALDQVLALPGPILIVSHGGVWKSVCRWLKQPYKGVVRNCALFQCTPSTENGEDWKVEELENQ